MGVYFLFPGSLYLYMQKTKYNRFIIRIHTQPKSLSSPHPHHIRIHNDKHTNQ